MIILTLLFKNNTPFEQQYLLYYMALIEFMLEAILAAVAIGKFIP